MWKNFPQHQLEYVREIPPYDNTFKEKIVDHAKLASIQNTKDFTNKLYKIKTHDEF